MTVFVLSWQQIMERGSPAEWRAWVGERRCRVRECPWRMAGLFEFSDPDDAFEFKMRWL